MGLRETIQNSPAVGIVIALVLIGVAVAVLMKPKAQPSLGDAYYYDLSTGQVFVYTKQAAPPVDVPGGAAKMGVRAHVFGCGDCSEANRRVAYLEKYSDAALAAMQATPQNEAEDMALQQAIINGNLVALPPRDGGEPQWIPRETEAGQGLLAAAAQVCGGTSGTRCTP